jgi:hypothetical protein
MQPAPTPDASAPAAADPHLTLDDLLFECGRLRIRVLVPLDLASATDPANTLALAKSWLYRGAAGFVLTGIDSLAKPTSAPSIPDANSVTPGPIHLHRKPASTSLTTQEPAILASLRQLLTQTPGDHILIGGPSSGDSAMPSPSLQLRIVSLGATPAANPQTAARLANLSTIAAPRALLSLDPPANAPLTGFTPIDAAILLANDQPAILESSLITPEQLARVFPPLAKPEAPETAAAPVPPPPPPPPENVYGTFKAYVPKQTNTAAERKRKAEAEEAKAEQAKIALDTFPVQPMYEPIRNTPEGLIAFDHRLIQLHRANPTLHDGNLHALDNLAPSALTWTALRAGSPPLIILCNPTNGPMRVDLSADLRNLGLGRNMSRTLLHTAPASGIQPVESINLAPQSVYIGELQRGSSYGH